MKGHSFQTWSGNRLDDNPLRFRNEIDFDMLVVNCLMCFHWNSKLSDGLSPFHSLASCFNQEESTTTCQKQTCIFDEEKELTSFGRARKKSPTLCIHVEQRFGTFFWYSWSPSKDFSTPSTKPTRRRPWQWEGHLPERMSWRFSTASYQEASTGLGGRNQTNRAFTECIFSKKLHQSGVKKEKFGLVLRVLFVGFCVSKISIWFCQRSCKAIQKWNGKPPLKVQMPSFTEMISPSHIFWDQEKNEGSKKKDAITSWFHPQIICFEGINKKPSYCSKAGGTAHERSSHIAVSISWLGTNVMTESKRDTSCIAAPTEKWCFWYEIQRLFSAFCNDWAYLHLLLFLQTSRFEFELKDFWCMLHDVYFCLHPQRKKKHEVFVFARFCPSKRWRFSSPPLSWWSWIRTFNRRRDGLGVPNAASKWLHGFKTTKLNGVLSSEELQVIFVSKGLEWKDLWAFCSPSLRKDFASGWSVEENQLTYKRS